MYTKDQICEKIRSMYPDIGACGIDLNVSYDKKNHAWSVLLKKDKKQLRTFLEDDDASTCIEGRHCLGLGMQIFQLKNNIKQLRFA